MDLFCALYDYCLLVVKQVIGKIPEIKGSEQFCQTFSLISNPLSLIG